MSFTINKPSAGGNWPKDRHCGDLHVFLNSTDFVGEERQGQSGSYLAVAVEHVVCLDHLEVWLVQVVSGAVLAPRLVGSPAGAVVGRLEQGDAKPGRSAPWLLTDPTLEDVAAAEEFLGKYATTMPSGSIALDVRAIRADAEPPEESF
jgi:hypothetical protein